MGSLKTKKTPLVINNQGTLDGNSQKVIPLHLVRFKSRPANQWENYLNETGLCQLIFLAEVTNSLDGSHFSKGPLTCGKNLLTPFISSSEIFLMPENCKILSIHWPSLSQ